MTSSTSDTCDFTFIAWADTHFGYDQRKPDHEDLRYKIIDQINSLVGRPYPDCIGGNVAQPDFVVHVGDIIDGVKPADIELGYYDAFISKLKLPSYEVLGNHDTTPEFLDRYIHKYESTSYSFNHRGIHFISLYSVYDVKEIGMVDDEALEFLQNDLNTNADAPAILCVHSRLDRLTNGDAILDILKGKRIILILSAHIHKPSVFELNGIHCIDLGQCRDHPIDPECGRCIYVITISGNSLMAIPWRWDYNDWERGQRWEHNSDKRMKSLILNVIF